MLMQFGILVPSYRGFCFGQPCLRIAFMKNCGKKNMGGRDDGCGPGARCGPGGGCGHDEDSTGDGVVMILSFFFVGLARCQTSIGAEITEGPSECDVKQT
eukprot:TRINITY_DN1462_c0_g1_i5.p1 TRINITY_DN1462_c0_g1~~TRINITY_DN1462_c0_g1_i5.p1  ORF type:complete len:100 (+),score=11.41 TRINITY_DN1462_c0_g1_i5:375-674(+)